MARRLAIKPAHPKLTVWAALRAVLRLVIPVIALLAIYVCAYLGMSEPITAFDIFPDEKWFLNPGYWLTKGHLILPFAFLVSNLTNRRYGETYAFAQLIVTWIVIGIALYAFMQAVGGALPFSPLPNKRTSLAFLFAIMIGQSAAIFIFERTRGRTWFGAPLFSALWGQTIFVLLYYTLAYVGMTDPWVNFMMMDLAINVAAAIILLIPYEFLRGIIKPKPGYGGA
jgi:hypothetical protein